MAVAIKHVHGVAEPLQEIRPDVKPEFLAIIARMMAKKPGGSVRNPCRPLSRSRTRAGR